MRVIFLLLSFIWPMLASAAADGDELRRRLDAVGAMSANFTQTIHAGERVVRTTTGSMAIKRPGLFRWETDKPFSQLIISDKNRVQIYNEDLNQVIIRKHRADKPMNPADLLSGLGEKLNKYYRVKKITQTSGISFELKTGYKASDFPYILLRFYQNQLRQMQFTDKLGNTVDLRFDKVRINQTLPQNLFKLSIPDKAEIISQ